MTAATYWAVTAYWPDGGRGAYTVVAATDRPTAVAAALRCPPDRVVEWRDGRWGTVDGLMRFAARPATPREVRRHGRPPRIARWAR